MKLLNNAEINSVSGAVIDFGDGVGLEVSSKGIPPQAYNFIDALQNQMFQGKISPTEAAVKVLNAGYADYFSIYCNHIQNGNVLFVMI